MESFQCIDAYCMVCYMIPRLATFVHLIQLHMMHDVQVGAAVTLTRMMEAFRRLIAERPTHQTSTLRAVVNQLRCGASCVCARVGGVYPSN
jgi:hypothetical protein